MTPIEFVTAVVQGRIELRAIKGKKCVSRQTGGDLQSFVDRWNSEADVYFGVLPRPIGPVAHTLWCDIDFKSSSEAIARERLAKFRPEPTWTVATGGGLHVYWDVDPPLPTNELKPILKAIATELGGDPACAEPARILRVPGTKNVKYDPPRNCMLEWADPVPLPRHPDEFRWLVGGLLHDLHMPSKNPEIPKGNKIAVTSPSALAKARAYMDMLPPAIEGDGGDEHTLKACMVLVRDLGLSDADALGLLLEWNALCEPAWTVDDLKAKLANARAYGSGAIGADDPEKDFAEIEPPDLPKPVHDFNQEFHVTDDAGQLRVYHMAPTEFGYLDWSSYASKDFVEVMTCVRGTGHLIEKVGKVQRRVPWSQAWLERPWEGKRTYSQVVFDPSNGHDPTRELNLFTGLAEPEDGDWECLEGLIRDVLCAESRETAEYLLDWCAAAVQRPWEKPGTTIVFRGDQGSGKSMFGKVFAGMFRAHGLVLDSPSQLVGRFNEHLRKTIGLFVDEAFWSGDRAAEAAFKGLVTEDRKMYEAKFKGLVSGRSYLRIIVATNNDRAANITSDDERRYVVVEPGPKRGREYYAEIAKGMRDGSLSRRFLAVCLRRDVSRFDPVTRPKGKAYQEQRAMSMRPEEVWLEEFRENEYRDDMIPEVKGRARTFRTSDIYAAVMRRYKDAGERAYERSNPKVLGAWLAKAEPKVQRIRVKANGEFFWCYRFPDIRTTDISEGEDLL